MSISEKLSEYTYAAGWRMVRSMPGPVASGLFNVGADFAARDGGPAQLRRNLARVLGVRDSEVPDVLMRASMRSYARYWREAFRLPSMNLAATAQSIDNCVEGREHLDAALARGRGVVAALPHSGNWDLAGVWLVNYNGTFTTVAERLKPESLFERFVSYRESLGFEIIPATGGDQPPSVILKDRLRAGGVVCLVADRDLTASGIPVDFFGETTSFPAGPAKLAAETGAALLPAHCWFTKTGWGFRVGEEIDVSAGVEAATQSLADAFSLNIVRYPADWHMLQPLWWSDLSQRRLERMGVADSGHGGGST
ncbi:phosphatidylinositol mannoside acyltransferase [Hoyosella rhizosphaerae]|uniref:Phosphatidylinositol mannoside acyltransferase n=1 Tax=Hoyosella rhizosphaerae TaxID=1755582 RepID=A0A916U5B5_9ACTN|nr:phosphatidylinositol mannoside acyltransferase [Hoyosella rhizosphaerae]MBN4926410.1 phosphatidylinositol mannoside acyltransferase [Hoyosella rhizosphaerae]GGC59593.1 phosphatidylinositol mannoside acyltransferase [Hoyosella rhizosphaerae]